MLGYSQSKRQIVWYPLPLRVFENAGELERFRELFGKPENPAAGWSAGMGRQPQTGAVFSFTFPVDEEKWISIYKNALMTINSGTLGFPQNMKTFLGVYGVVFVVAGLFWVFQVWRPYARVSGGAVSHACFPYAVSVEVGPGKNYPQTGEERYPAERYLRRLGTSFNGGRRHTDHGGPEQELP